MSHTITSRSMIARSRRAPGQLARVFRAMLDRFLLLPIGAAIALVWANTEPESYFRFSHAAAFPVNEIGMVFFLGMVAQEAFEAVMSGGALHAWRYSTLALIGALGGIAGAAAAFFIFINLSHELVLAQAWPVACAVDVAAAYYVVKLIYPRHHGAVPFLLMLALITDAVAMAIAPIVRSEYSLQRGEIPIPMGGLALLAMAVLLAVALKRARIRSLWPYLLLCGSVSWLALYGMGFHPALALLPIIPLMPHRPRPLDLFADRPEDGAIRQREHKWNGIAQVALFCFGLVNAGIILKDYDTGTWAILMAAIVGRPLGIVAALALAAIVGPRWPGWLAWRDLLVLGLATSSGFTFALFMATAVLPMGGVAGQVKLGALATVAGAAFACLMAWLLGAGRFAKQRGRTATPRGGAHVVSAQA